MDRDVAIAALHHTHPAIFTFTDYATDAVPHRFWRYREPQRFPDTDPALVQRWGSAIDNTYLQADDILGELRKEVGPQARVVVLSDHGHHAMEGAALGHLLQPLTERLSERMKAEVGPVDISRLGHKLVVALQAPDPVSERASLTTWVQTLVVERTQKPLFRVEEGPDGSLGLAVMEEGLSPENLETDRVGQDPLSAYFSAGEAFSGDHHDRGIWISAGPGLAAGKTPPELGLLDVTPTLLAMMGLPKAQDMTGSVATSLWEGPLPDLGPEPATYDSLAAKRDFVIHGDGTEDVNEEQLKALGYVQ
jgi:arylsulfatase A-like enzyme